MNGRFVGVDLLRSIILIFGPTFHASMLMDGAFGFDGYLLQSPLVRGVLQATNPFRMDLFFLISGFFSSLVISRKGGEYFIQGRIKKIVYPTIFSILTVVPITFFLIYFIQGEHSVEYNLSYRHVWFLVTLSIISLLVCLAPYFFYNIANSITRRMQSFGFFYTIIFFCSITTFFVAMSMFIGRLFSFSEITRYVNILLQFSSSIGYFGFFFVGMCVFFLNKKVNTKIILFFAFAFLLWYVTKCFVYPDYKFFFVATKPAISLLMSFSIFSAFLNMNINSSKIITSVSESALVFYLIHLPILIGVSAIWFHFTKSDSVILFSLVVIPLNLIITYLMSRYIIKVFFIRRVLGISC